ncbi:hypothetical protein [Cellulomonas taurus]|uniref:hypothetical protein n=1 Tax=Cellulomonas taurus TaxID=2729175 RepID=UPI00145EE612|nr:hypothetical protein [Cellulomonas taurus]
MVDLSPIFATAESLVRQAVASASTEVTITTGGRRFTDPDTLQEVAEGGTTVGPVAAIVAPVSSGQTTEALPGLEVRARDWKVVCTPDMDDPDPAALIEVTASRDTQLITRTATVLGAVRSSAGAALIVYARPTRPGRP